MASYGSGCAQSASEILPTLENEAGTVGGPYFHCAWEMNALWAGLKADGERPGYLLCKLFLHGKGIGQGKLVALAPQLGLVFRINQPGRYPRAIPTTPHTPFQDVVHSEVLSDLVQRPLSVVTHGRSSTDNAQPLGIELAKVRDHFFRQSFAEGLVRRIVTEIFKRQYDQSDGAIVRLPPDSGHLAPPLSGR